MGGGYFVFERADIDTIQKHLKSEYDLARHEWEYYTELFNKQDNLYSIYFAIFAVVIGAIYYIITVNNKGTLFDNITLLQNQKLIICGLLAFLAITYMYLFVIMLGNSYYLIIYSEKAIVLKKLLNHFLGVNIYIWETDFMSIIQSTENIITKGYINVNMFKMVYAILLYLSIEIPLCILWYVVNGRGVLLYVYMFLVIGASVLLAYDWLIMWWRLPKHYRKVLSNLYLEKLCIRGRDH